MASSHAVGLRGLRRVYDVHAARATEGLRDMDLGGLEVDIRRCQCEHLANAQSAPEQYPEGDVRIRLVGHGIREAKVLLSCPEVHLALLFGADLPCDLHRVPLKAVEAHQMVHDRGELAAKGVQVGGSVGRAALGAALKQMVLPVDDGLRVDIAYEHALKIGLQYLLNVVPLLFKRGFSYAWRIVFKVDVACEGELHRCRPRHLPLEIALPCLGIALRAESSFRLLF